MKNTERILYAYPEVDSLYEVTLKVFTEYGTDLTTKTIEIYGEDTAGQKSNKDTTI